MSLDDHRPQCDEIQQETDAFYRTPPRSASQKHKRQQAFPYWTLLVIALCIVVWAFCAKLYEERAMAYESYKAMLQDINRDTFFPGVTVDGMDMSDMTLDQARALYTNRQQEQSDAFSLVVASGSHRWRITSDQVPMTFNAQKVLERAYAVGRVGTLEDRLADIQRVAQEGASFETGFVYDRSVVRGLVDTIGDSLDVAPQDASLDAFDVITRTFSFKEAKAGSRIDRAALEEDILAALDAGAYDQVVQPDVSVVEPNVWMAQLQGQFGRISSFTTTTTNDRDRNTNISISAAALNGQVVQPGETLSFNACTGKRTGEKGYREAGAIAGGVLVDDTGGGVCQTSSTLFNAVVRADLEIVERNAHSWPSSYVNKGEDATVNWPSLDFVFRNNGQYPVFVVAWYEDQAVTIEIYGKLLEDGGSIDLQSELIQTIKPSNDILYTLDETLPVGTRKAGHSKRTGYVVDTYKVYLDADGNETRRVKLWRTTYRATQREILYNDGSTMTEPVDEESI